MDSQGTQAYATFLVEKAEHIATVRFNRPAKLNPINQQVIRDLDAIVRELEEDYESRVLVLTGQGRSFSVGADGREARAAYFDQRHPIFNGR